MEDNNEDYSNRDEVVLSNAASGAYEIVYVDSRSTFQAIETTINLSTPPTLENIQKNHANRNFVYSGGLIAACSVPLSRLNNNNSNSGNNPSNLDKNTGSSSSPLRNASSSNDFSSSPTNTNFSNTTASSGENTNSQDSLIFQQHSRGVVPHGKGKLYYEDTGELYQGDWAFGKREGRGVWIGPKIERKIPMTAKQQQQQLNSSEQQQPHVTFLSNNNNNNDDSNTNGNGNNNNNLVPPSFQHPTHAQAGVLPERPSYEGEWRNDKKHGKGSEQFPDGRYYVGDFKNGICAGTGCLTFPSGDTFRGVFNADGVPHDPKGEYTFANGDVLSGPWVEGKRHGTFTVSFASSPQHSYQGVFVNDQSMGITCLT